MVDMTIKMSDWIGLEFKRLNEAYFEINGTHNPKVLEDESQTDMWVELSLKLKTNPNTLFENLNQDHRAMKLCFFLFRTFMPTSSYFNIAIWELDRYIHLEIPNVFLKKGLDYEVQKIVRKILVIHPTTFIAFL